MAILVDDEHLQLPQQPQQQQQQQNGIDIESTDNKFTAITTTSNNQNKQEEGARRGQEKVWPRARVIGIIPINNELDLLVIRLHELDSVVDTFVILESPFAESTLPVPPKTYHDRWLGSHNNNWTLAELDMYEQATKNNCQDGGFRIRYSKETPGLPSPQKHLLALFILSIGHFAEYPETEGEFT